jgi:hypothetical protein
MCSLVMIICQNVRQHGAHGYSDGVLPYDLVTAMKVPLFVQHFISDGNRNSLDGQVHSKTSSYWV